MSGNTDRKRLLSIIDNHQEDDEEIADYSITSPMRMFDSSVYDPEKRDRLMLPEYSPRHGELLYDPEKGAVPYNPYRIYIVSPKGSINPPISTQELERILNKIDEVMNNDYEETKK